MGILKRRSMTLTRTAGLGKRVITDCDFERRSGIASVIELFVYVNI
jgi:hypothetical protein